MLALGNKFCQQQKETSIILKLLVILPTRCWSWWQLLRKYL